jgi:hypothetical protein
MISSRDFACLCHRRIFARTLAIARTADTGPARRWLARCHVEAVMGNPKGTEELL